MNAYTAKELATETVTESAVILVQIPAQNGAQEPNVPQDKFA